MPTFKVSHHSELSAESAFAKVRNVIDSNDSFRSIDPHYVVNYDAPKLQGKATSKMFKARFDVCQAGAGSTVTFTVDLPLKYALAKTLVTRSLKEKMREEL